MFSTGQNVVAKIQRCACTGGGFTEVEGPIIGIINNTTGPWYQINTPNGVVVVSHNNILRTT